MTNTENFAGDWCRKGCACGRERGSASRMQMRAYALDVAIAMHGASVCHCGAPLSLTDGEVDRTDEGTCYRPGHVVMTCYTCNNDRTTVKGFDNVAFANDVLNASQNVFVPSKSDAKRRYEIATIRGASVRKSKYFRG
jgi:hypothetical protein